MTTHLESALRYLVRSERSASRPAEVYLEPTNRCNLSCASCPRTRMDRPVGEMGLELFHHIATGLAGGTELVNLYTYGEPLLHPAIDRMVATLAGLGIASSITTNGTRLDRRTSELLVAAGLSHMIVSLDTDDPVRYRDLRRGGQFELVIENLHYLAEVVRTRHAPTVVHLSAVLTDQLKSHFGSFVAFARTLPIDGVRFERFIDVSRDPSLASGSLVATCASAHTHFYLWRKLYVYWDGHATTCPYHLWTFDEGLSDGDLREESVETLWNGPVLRARRARALAGEPLAPLCEGCGFPPYPRAAIAVKALVHEKTFISCLMPTLSGALAHLDLRRS